MDDYVSVFQYKNNVGISFDVEAEKPFRVGEQMNAVYEMAYMNGYNWAALLDWYLAQREPALLEGLGESALQTALRALEDSLSSLEAVEEVRFLVDGEFRRDLGAFGGGGE